MLIQLIRSFYILITLAVTAYLIRLGRTFYALPLEERFYHEDYSWLRASGLLGHGLGILGTAMIAIGVFLYIGAKKYGWLTRWFRLRYLLEFHIFLCTLGPILIVFHTTFKFGGIVSVAFWSMVIVVLSGIVGRFLYIRLPRDWQGRELSLEGALLLKEEWMNEPVSHERTKRIQKLERQMKSMERNQKYFQYWHIAHRPFALIMFVIVLVHIAVTLLYGFNLTGL